MNKQFKLLTAVLAVGSLLLLSGCTHYKAITLPRLAKHSDQSEKKGLTLEHKIFTKQDCKTYLGKKNLLKKGFQPVQLTLTNNTDHSYTYSASSLSLPTVPAKLVAKKVKFSTAGRIIGYSLAGATILIPTALVGSLFYPVAPVAAFVAGSYFAGFSIAGIVDGVKSHKANKELSADFADKELPFKGLLNPYQSINGIIFVPKKSFNPNFTFTLNNLKNNKAIVLHSNADYVDIK